MPDISQPPDAATILSDVERSARQVGFNMPASWEECEALGLDPLTGEPT